ncbi:MAG: hypothetical protein ACOCPM_03010 [Bacteroidales bacterium]
MIDDNITGIATWDNFGVDIKGINTRDNLNVEVQNSPLEVKSD